MLSLLAQTQTATTPPPADPAASAAALLGLACAGLFLVVLAVLPGIIAFSRGHPNAVPITLVSVLLGWTCAGWVWAFIWAFTNPAAPSQTVIVNRGRRRRDEDDD